MVPAWKDGHMPDFRHLIDLCARTIGACRGTAARGSPF
jgi:hypothetical protein